MTGWRLSLVGAATCHFVQPVEAFAYGQVGILLVALVVLDTFLGLACCRAGSCRRAP
jgi:hypothetical protein